MLLRLRLPPRIDATVARQPNAAAARRRAQSRRGRRRRARHGRPSLATPFARRTGAYLDDRVVARGTTSKGEVHRHPPSPRPTKMRRACDSKVDRALRNSTKRTRDAGTPAATNSSRPRSVLRARPDRHRSASRFQAAAHLMHPANKIEHLGGLPSLHGRPSARVFCRSHRSRQLVAHATE